MATHSQNIENLRTAANGEEVRGSMIELFEEDYNLSKIAVGTSVTSSASSVAGYTDGTTYINNETWDLFKLEVNRWVKKGNIAGNKWNRGRGVSGKSRSPVVMPTSGVTYANAGDFYLNVEEEGTVYHCETAGGPSTATWVYDFILGGAGGGGVSDWIDINLKPFETIDTERSFKVEADKLKLKVKYVTQAEYNTLKSSGQLDTGDYRITDAHYKDSSIKTNLNAIRAGSLLNDDVAGAIAVEELLEIVEDHETYVHTTPFGSIKFYKRGRNISFYGELTGLNANANPAQLGTIPTRLVPNYDYVIGDARNADANPYPSVGSIWIGYAGVVTLYRPAANTHVYVGGSYTIAG